MKTTLVRQCSLIVAAGLTFSLGCARPAAQTEQPKTVAAPPVPQGPGVQGAPLAPAPADPIAAADTNAPAILDRIDPVGKPETVVSPGLAEVVKLAQAGVGEEVILAYVEKYEGNFNVGADQILYLNDLGVSGSIITSMLKHDGTETAATSPSPEPLVQKQIVSNVPQNQATPSYAVAEPPAPAVTTQAPPPSPEASHFYDTLAPYGSWMNVSGYGWCWQPTVAVSVPTWRPYCDRGRWYWSDAGWYWSSDYSWGWAAFHYGRWYHHPRSGWLWTPGTTWAPSWVSWRYSDGYCGWAPLPPEAYYASGVGFSYHSRRVSIGFDFGLTDFHYSFVSVNNFCDYSPYRYVVPRARVQNFYRNTTVINNYVVGNNNTVINHGIGRDTVARSSQTRIREVAVRERPVQNASRIRGDQIERQGNQLVVYRPQLPSKPPQIRTAQFANRSGGQAQAATTVARNGNNISGTANLSQNSTLPSSGGRVPSSVVARSRETAVETPGQQQRGEDRNARAVATQRANTSVASATAANSGGGADRNVTRQSQQNADAQTQEQYRRQQQLRGNAPLFGATVAGGSPPQENAAGTRRNLEARNNAAAAARVQAQQQSGVQRPQQGNPATPRNAEQRNNSAGAPRTQQQPQYQAPQNNAAAPRAAIRAYPQHSAPAPAVQAEPHNNQRAGRNYAEPTTSPRQAEQLPRYSAPVQQAPQYSAPAARQYSPPPQRQEAPRSAPSSGGGGGGRESAPSRVDRAERNR